VARADSAGEVEFADVSAEDTGAVSLTLAVAGSALATAQTRAIPGWVSVLPPLVAIFIALVFHSVIPALFIGAWLGAFAIVGIHPAGLWMGLLSVFQVHVKEAVADPDHAAIMLFTFMIGGMVGIVSRNGGMQGWWHGSPAGRRRPDAARLRRPGSAWPSSSTTTPIRWSSATRCARLPIA
jgi:hypothetical protein